MMSGPYEAIVFETPPLQPGHLGDPFEFVVLDAPQLARVDADPSAFRSQLDAARLEKKKKLKNQ